ncbi:LOW QUALITY PROTEIN: angiomotin-like protein 2 [Tribolium madens]|uniref:LOW QUALITY PROTEIN: angiomotin-like protein 2 n=1 Tax=Tribolium madens TaxID=41895 RepID=UPI001CF725F8|nr:LOW QUALITY PROTEIN: angiomotin-like protein 2 [Tribolium madens]
MGSLQQPNRFRPFNQTTPQSAFPQSLSGSETDISTSNENLSNEEKYVIRHTARQEPQGQENQQASNRSSLRDSLPSNRSSLDVSSSSYNTLIIHSAGDEPWTGNASHVTISPHIAITGRNSGVRDGDAYHPHQSSNLYDPKLSPNQKRSSASPRTSFDGNTRIYDTGVQEITEIPDDYLSQSSVLKHLAKEVKVPSPFDNPPPEYPKWADKSPLQAVVHRNNINNEKLTLSKSQPDLSKVGVPKGASDFDGFRRGVSAPRPPTKGREESETGGGELWPSAEMVEILIKENSALKIELENCYKRVAKTQKLEQEILKVHKAQEELVQSCERKERLEKAARGRLQNDNRRLQELNRALREQVDLLSTQMMSRSPAPDSGSPDCLRRELSKREVLIAQLIQQNKEHVAAKERQEIELAAQRVTLQEQRTHIDILDTALTNAQANVVRLEEECRKKQVYVERVVQLQRALSSLQLASDRREQTERKLRLQLERELQRTKLAQGEGGKSGWDSPNGSGNESPSELKRRLREKDEKIMQLEGDCTKWEQRYLEESALRQAAIDAASIPKDAKIAALEKTSQETEKIIAEARNEKIRHMDEVHAAQKKVADLESRVKDLESKLAERDAMIKVLQKHTYDKDVSSMLGRSPHHTPHPSLGGADIDHVLGTAVSREELVSSVLTSSTGFGSGNSYAGSDSSYHMPSYTKYENKSFDSTKQSLDNQLKEIDSQLDSQLLSKRGLCCFPGFTNPVTAQRKGKIPKPLLAGVTGGGAGGGVAMYEPGAMLLLEKQGRASQQQRMQDTADSSPRCPAPSSLPRPPRPSHRSGLPRRLGDYNRLAEGETPPRKKSDGGDSLSSNASSRRASPARSLIPPRKLGEYGRLSESGGSSASLRKPTNQRSRSGGERDSASTLSDNSASSLPTPSKVRLFGGGAMRRGGSLGRDSKSSTDSTTSKYRIQF